LRRIINTIGRWLHSHYNGNDTIEYWETIEHVKPKSKKFYDPFNKKDSWY